MRVCGMERKKMALGIRLRKGFFYSMPALIVKNVVAQMRIRSDEQKLEKKMISFVDYGIFLNCKDLNLGLPNIISFAICLCLKY